MEAKAFDIFPLEVWEVLLETFPAEDAYNTYLAFPDIRTEAVISAMLPKWMFNMVAHRVCVTWMLTREEILNCRLVCRQWCEGIDRIVQHDPRYFAYPYNADAGLLPLLNGNPFRTLPYSMLGRSPVFGNSEILRNFQATMGRSIRNPFLFRGVRLVPQNREAPVLGLTSFWKSGLDFLETFGRDIRFLDIFSDESYRSSIVQFLLRALPFTPNLKSLFIGDSGLEFGMGNEWMLEIVDELTLPPMRQLECIYFGLAPDILTRWLMNVYGEQLKKITIHLDIWREEYSGLFPNLTDLHLFGGGIAGMSMVLTSIHSPLLASIMVDAGQLCGEEKRSLHSTIIPMLERFPGLEYFIVGRLAGTHSRFYPVMDLCPKTSTHSMRIPSVKSLNIQWERLAMNLDLLMCFPNLRNISVYIPLSCVGFFEESHLLWEVACPKLEFVRACGFKYGREYACYHNIFDRDNYIRRKGQRPPQRTEKQDDDITLMEGIVGLFS